MSTGYKSMEQTEVKRTNIQNHQIKRIDELIPALQHHCQKNEHKYLFYYWITAIISFLSGITGASFLTQAATHDTWSRAANLILGILPLLQAVSKLLGLEDKKNEAQNLIRVAKDLIVRLHSAKAKLKDLAADGVVIDDELDTWNKIIDFIGKVDALNISLGLGDPALTQRLNDLQKTQRQLQLEGITGIRKLGSTNA